MGKKRNPKSKRVHDSDTGKFIPESSVNELTPFGYDDDGNGGAGLSVKTLILLAGVVVALAYVFGYTPF